MWCVMCEVTRVPENYVHTWYSHVGCGWGTTLLHRAPLAKVHRAPNLGTGASCAEVLLFLLLSCWCLPPLHAGHDESFTSNTLELTRVQRGPGLNDVGMVAWHMTLKTPECQQGRQVRP